MAYKIMKKDKIGREFENVKIAHGKGVNSTDLLCKDERIKNEPENIGDDLIIGSFIKYKGKYFGFYVRLEEKDQNWKKAVDVTGKHGFLSSVTIKALEDNKFIPGPFDLA